MSSHPATAAETADPTQRHLAILDGLITLGEDFARAIHAQGIGLEATLPLAEAAKAFDRVVRTVRRTVLLFQKLTRDAASPARPEPGPDRALARRRILRAVEDSIGHNAEGKHAESLRAELLDRIDSPDVEFDIAHRPIAEIIIDIIRDLGLIGEPGFTPYQRRTQADIAQLLARAAAPPKPAASAPSAAMAPAPPATTPKPEPGFPRLAAVPPH